MTRAQVTYHAMGDGEVSISNFTAFAFPANITVRWYDLTTGTLRPCSRTALLLLLLLLLCCVRC